MNPLQRGSAHFQHFKPPPLSFNQVLKTPYLKAPWRNLPPPLLRLEKFWARYPVSKLASLTAGSLFMGWSTRIYLEPDFTEELLYRITPASGVLALPHPLMILGW